MYCRVIPRLLHLRSVEIIGMMFTGNYRLRRLFSMRFRSVGHPELHFRYTLLVLLVLLCLVNLHRSDDIVRNKSFIKYQLTGQIFVPSGNFRCAFYIHPALSWQSRTNTDSRFWLIPKGACKMSQDFVPHHRRYWIINNFVLKYS
jgi:hypothetical protein